MPAKNVDIVFVVDASESMGPCFERLCSNIGVLLETLKQASYNTNLGLLIHRMPNPTTYSMIGLSALDGVNVTDMLYQSGYQNEVRGKLFTKDTTRFTSLFNSVSPQGDENSLVALDLACDFPFGPLQTHQRVIVLLTDETFETGYHPDESIRKIPQLIEKIHARNITLFAALPPSPAANELSCAHRADFITLDNPYDGLRDFDFQDFFRQIGKTISVTVTQLNSEPAYTRALFGQNNWVSSMNTVWLGDVGYNNRGASPTSLHEI